MFSLKKVDNLRVREPEREEKGTMNLAPQSAKRCVKFFNQIGATVYSVHLDANVLMSQKQL